MEHLKPVSYVVVFLWGIFVLVGLIGLGRLVARAIGGDAVAKGGWGLDAVWGMAVYLFTGGLLALCGACGDTAITLLLGVGVANAAWTALRGERPTRASLAALPWHWWPAFAVTAFIYAGGLCWQGNVNPGDDLPAYYHFCEKLLTTGSFAEPFSWRRLASLGGHTLLQCTMLVRGSWINAQAFETALCPVILLGLVLGFRGGVLRRGPLGLFLALLAITTPIIRVNSASHFTGMVLFVGLFITLDMIGAADARRPQLFAVAGLVAAALCSLRAQNVPAAGGALGLFWLLSWMKDRPAPRIALTEAACWGAGFVIALLPWMIMSWQSNGSPLYPLVQGGNNPAFNPQTLDGSLYARLQPAFQMFLHPAILPILVCLLAVPGWRRGLPAQALAIAAVFTSVAVAYTASLAPDTVTIPRYVQPLLMSAALAVLMTAAVSARGRLVAFTLGVILLATTFSERSFNLSRYYAALGYTDSLILPLRTRTVADYIGAQSLVPEDKRILVCGDYPFLFDDRRNPIWSIDLPNACSPRPGLPFQKPPEETKRYLRSLGIEYVIFVDPAASPVLYNRKGWQDHAAGDIALWKIQAPYFLDFFDTEERLAATETTLGKVGNLIVLQFKP